MRLISCKEFEKKLKFAFENIMNVLVEGKHGVGKTSIIHNVLEAEGLTLGKDYVCFSAATMDPWIDFLGIPRLSENNGIPVVKLVKPEYIDANSIQVLFFDEFNRAPKRVRNAVMELIQFKSVNGVKFPKLKCIWAAINPDDDSGTYDVERIDPAQLDRFQLQFQIKEELNIDYFIKKFGEEKASSAQEWYESLDDAQRNVISPRRVQYALEILKNGGDPADVFPVQIDANDFANSINSLTTKTILMRAANNNDLHTIKELLKDFDTVMNAVSKTQNPVIMNACAESMNEEQLASCLVKNEKMRFWCESNILPMADMGKDTEPEGQTGEPSKMQKKLLTCVAELARNRTNKSAYNWAESIMGICVPGHKILLNKEMTQKEFCFQARMRYEICPINDWEYQHPSFEETKHFSELAKLSFSSKNEPISREGACDMMAIAESAVKMRKVRTLISTSVEFANMPQNICQLMHYIIGVKGKDKNKLSSSYEYLHEFSDCMTIYSNIFKYLIAPYVDMHGSYNGFKLTKKAKLFNFIK